MKKLLFFSAIVMLMSSCLEKKEFTINGKMGDDEFEGRQVYLQEVGADWKEKVTIDTAVIENGAFKFKGVVKESNVIRFVVLAEPDSRRTIPATVIIEHGKIELAFDSVPTVGGTPANDSYQAYASKMYTINQDINALYEKSQQDTANVVLQADLEKQYEAKDAEAKKALYDYVKANIKNQAGTYFFATRGYQFSLDELKELMPLISPEFKSNERIQSIEKRAQALEATQVGNTFVDIRGNAPDGKEVALSDYAGKGNYVLIDFWASWCPPCRRDMPILVEAYKKYSGKGFEIVGVSIDNDKAAWEKGIKDLNITWPQMSDLKGWKSDLSGAYGVASIPHTVLLDKEGKIIAKDLHGKQITDKLDELLK